MTSPLWPGPGAEKGRPEAAQTPGSRPPWGVQGEPGAPRHLSWVLGGKWGARCNLGYLPLVEKRLSSTTCPVNLLVTVAEKPQQLVPREHFLFLIV